MAESRSPLDNMRGVGGLQMLLELTNNLMRKHLDSTEAFLSARAKELNMEPLLEINDPPEDTLELIECIHLAHELQRVLPGLQKHTAAIKSILDKLPQ